MKKTLLPALVSAILASGLHGCGGGGGSGAENADGRLYVGVVGQTEYSSGDTLTLTANMRSTGGKVNQAYWQQISGPTLQSLSGTDCPTVDGDAAETCQLTGTVPVDTGTPIRLKVTAIDERGFIEDETVTLSIANNANYLPSLTAMSVDSAAPGSPVSVRIYAQAVGTSVANVNVVQIAGPSVLNKTGFDCNNTDSTGYCDVSFELPFVEVDTQVRFRLDVVDGKGQSASAEHSITIDADASDVPTLAASADRQVVSPGETVNLDLYAHSPAQSLVSVYWAPNASIELGSNLNCETHDSQDHVTDSGVKTLSMRCASSFVVPNTSGELALEARVVDEFGRSAKDTVSLTVLPPGSPGSTTDLVVKASNDWVVASGETASLHCNASGGYSNADHPMTYAWEITAPAGFGVYHEARGYDFTPPVTSVETVYTLRCTVTDGLGVMGHDDVQVTARAAGAPSAMQADAGLAQVVAPGSVVALDASASQNPEGGELHYRWTQVVVGSEPAVDLGNTTSARASFTAPSLPYGVTQQVYHFQVQVDDQPVTDATVAEAGEVAETVVVVECDTSDPSCNDGASTLRANAGPAQTVDANDPVSLDGTQSVDDEGLTSSDRLYYLWEQVSLGGEPMVTLANTQSAQASFSAPCLEEGSPPLDLTFQLYVDTSPITDPVMLPAGQKAQTVVKVMPTDAVCEGALTSNS